MITLLTGENSFELERALKEIIGGFDGTAEKVDGSELELKQLPDLLMGGTLFADKRLVIIKNLSDNKAVWTSLEDWMARVSDDIQLVLVEPKPDKRTKTYKNLKKVAGSKEFSVWSERDIGRAEQWVSAEANALGFELDKKSAQALVRRVGTDQWLLTQALQKLIVIDVITPAIIEDIIDASPTENVFYLFEAALKGNAMRVRQMMTILESTEDPYRLFGLLGGQVFQLAALSVADVSPAEVAKDIGVHPYALAKLTPFVNKLGRAKIKQIVTVFAEADTAMKTSAGEPWLLIERALMKAATL